MGWVDRIVFKGVDISDKNAFVAARKTSENIIGFLYKWYKRHYLKEHREGFNVYLERQIGAHSVYAPPAVVILDDEPELWIFDTREIQYLYKDFELRLLVWLLIDAIDVPAIILKYAHVSPNFGFTVRKERIMKKNVRNINQYARHIADCISKNIDYPSTTPMCYTCEKKDKCIV
jgi:hypothetical protein